MLINDLVASQSYPWPYPELLADGATHALSLTLGPLQLTSYRLQLNGNELQADLGFTLSGSFNYQIILWAQDGSTYSDPWMATNGIWQSSGSSSALTAVWANSGEDKIPSEDIRASQGQTVTNTIWDGTNVNLFGAQNEVVAFNLVLEAAQQPASNVSINFSTLTGPNGFTISSAPHDFTQAFNWTERNIELFYVRYLQVVGCGTCPRNDQRQVPPRFQLSFNGTDPTFGPSWNVTGTWDQRLDHDKHYPEIAVPIELYPDGFSIAQGSSQSIWTDIYIPKTASPGTYSGTVTISENGIAIKTVPVNLTVENFMLSDVPTSKTMLSTSRAPLMARLTGYDMSHDPYPQTALEHVELQLSLADRLRPGRLVAKP